MMTKLEYLKILEAELKGRLGRSEVDEIMRDYAEYFVEGQKQGKSDYEIAYSLGDPREVAMQIIAESMDGRNQNYKRRVNKDPYNTKESVNRAAQNVKSAAGKATGCLGKAGWFLLGLICVPAVFTLAMFVISFIAFLFAILVAGVAMCAALVVGAIAMLFLFGMSVGVLPVSALLLILIAAVALVAGGILGISIMLFLVQQLWKGTVWLFRYTARQVRTRGGRRPDPKVGDRAEDPQQPSNTGDGYHSEWDKTQPTEDPQPETEEMEGQETFWQGPILELPEAEGAPEPPQDEILEAEFREIPAEEYGDEAVNERHEDEADTAHAPEDTDGTEEERYIDVDTQEDGEDLHSDSSGRESI